MQYGPRVRAYVIYLKDYALLPYQRLRQVTWDLFGISVSTGTLARMEQECAERLSETVEGIRATIQQAPVGHFDETGLRVEGQRGAG